jgi:hypothetical protein
MISTILYILLSPLYPTTLYSATAPILEIGNFAVSIGPPCSGIDSMFLFIAFFAAIFALDHKKLKTVPFIITTIVGIIGTYIVNIIRLLLLMIIGVEISPRLAVGIFHTNAGWLFFVLYFISYYLVTKRFIYKKGLLKQK